MAGELGKVDEEWANSMGLDLNDYSNWTAYDQGTDKSMLAEQAVKDDEGFVIGFLKENKVTRYPKTQLMVGNRVYTHQREDEVTKATLVKHIRKKYKGKADEILKYLVKMCNDFNQHSGDGAAYHAVKKPWCRFVLCDSKKKPCDREMTQEEKMQVFLDNM